MDNNLDKYANLDTPAKLQQAFGADLKDIPEAREAQRAAAEVLTKSAIPAEDAEKLANAMLALQDIRNKHVADETTQAFENQRLMQERDRKMAGGVEHIDGNADGAKGSQSEQAAKAIANWMTGRGYYDQKGERLGAGFGRGFDLGAFADTIDGVAVNGRVVDKLFLSTKSSSANPNYHRVDGEVWQGQDSERKSRYAEAAQVEGSDYKAVTLDGLSTFGNTTLNGMPFCSLEVDPDICQQGFPSFDLCCFDTRPLRSMWLAQAKVNSICNNANGVPEAVYANPAGCPPPTRAINATSATVLKPEFGFTVQTVLGKAGKVAAYIPITEETSRFCSSLESLARQLLEEGIDRKIGELAFTAAPTAANGLPQGILGLPGILQSTWRGIPRGLATDYRYDAIKRAQTDMIMNGQSKKVCVTGHPYTFERMETEKSTGAPNLPLFGINDCNGMQLCDVEFCYNAAIPVGQLLVSSGMSMRLYVDQDFTVKRVNVNASALNNTEFLVVEKWFMPFVCNTQGIELVSGL